MGKKNNDVVTSARAALEEMGCPPHPMQVLLSKKPAKAVTIWKWICQCMADLREKNPEIFTPDLHLFLEIQFCGILDMERRGHNFDCAISLQIACLPPIPTGLDSQELIHIAAQISGYAPDPILMLKPH